MSDAIDPKPAVSPVKRALMALEAMQSRLDAVEYARNEPIAIVGMGCRLPGGANDPDAFWRLLHDGRDAIREVPKERWDVERFYDRDPAAPGKANSRWAGTLDRVDGFDASFFGIPHREAASIDPQQRLFLEVAWEALERAGQTAERLRGSATGVFVGVCSTDYMRLLELGPASDDAYALTGNSPSFASGRLSYHFDLQGPSVTLDTACSSSLVAVDAACRALRERTCDLAVAGGVNLILSPATTSLVSKLFALSPEGRCKAFDASADGFVRSEGCGAIVLKRLSDALRDGDPILAQILGSAVTQDGQSTGITAPNGLSQRAVVRRALREARVRPDEVSYVEAHGTGTALGDPIEVEALKEVVGQPRSDGRVCALASVKTNLGHLEAAAGIAGLIKVVLCLQREEIPPHLHFRSLNPAISFDGTPFVIPTEALAWPRGAARRVAGVSSFGLSGTNAHVVVAEAQIAPNAQITASSAEARTSEDAGDDGLASHVLPISARSPEALLAIAGAYREVLGGVDADRSLRDVCFSASVRRSHHAVREAFVGDSAADLVAQLDAYVGDARGARGGERVDTPPRMAFVFSGHGSHSPGMGRVLLRRSKVFRDALEGADAAVRAITGWSPIDEMLREGAGSRLVRNDVVQPVLFAFQAALVALWSSFGISPDVVVGHSVGEVGAARAAGALTIEDAARIVCTRSALVQTTAGAGRMALVELAQPELEEEIARYGGALSLAAVNGPETGLVSGEPRAVAELLERLTARAVFTRALDIDIASHGPQMEPLLPSLVRDLAPIRPGRAAISMVSTTTGRALDGTELVPAYWARNLRDPVLFHPVLRELMSSGVSIFVEVSAHPVLAMSMARACEGTDAVALPTLRRDDPDGREMLRSLARIYAAGHDVSWSGLHPAAGRVVPLPAYPWQRTRCWSAPPHGSRSFASAAHAGHHPLLGTSTISSVHAGTTYFGAEVGVHSPEYLDDHRVRDHVVFPAAGYLEMALGAAGHVLPSTPVLLEGVTFESILTLASESRIDLQTALIADGSGGFSFQIASAERSADRAGAGESERHSEDGTAWTVRARGTIRAAANGAETMDAPFDPAFLNAARARCAESLDAAQFYRSMDEAGIHYGPSFRGVSELFVGEGIAVARLALPASVVDDPASYAAHPAALDACLQVLAAAMSFGRGDTYLPVGVERLRLRGPLTGDLWAVCHMRGDATGGAESLAGDVVIVTAAGEPVARAAGITVKRAAIGHDPIEDWLYEIAWLPRPSASPVAAAPPDPGASPDPGAKQDIGDWLIFTDARGVGTALASRLRASGGRCSMIAIAGEAGGDRFDDAIDPTSPDEMARVVREFFGGANRGAARAGVVFLWGLVPHPSVATASDFDRVVDRGPCAATHLVQALAGLALRDPPRLWIVTANAQAMEMRSASPPPGETRSASPPLGEPAPVEPAYAMLWGWGRAVAYEHPELRCARVDLGDATDDEVEALHREICGDPDDDQIALRGRERLVCRIVRARSGAGAACRSDSAAGRVRTDGSYVVTGGLGGLGVKIAGWLAERGAARVVLVGRSDPSDAVRAELARLAGARTEILVERGDVCDPADVDRVLNTARAGGVSLRGVVHAAMVLDDGVLLKQDRARFARVIAPKVRGAWNLHEKTCGDALDFFVMFSSAASVMGSAAQSSYAAANAFLDALAHQRRSEGLCGLSINWGAWSEVGQAARKGRHERLQGQGIDGLSPAQGLAAFERVLEQERTQVMVVRLNGRQWRQSNGRVASLPFYSKLVHATGTSSGALRRELSTLAPEDRRRRIEGYVREQAAQVLRIAPARLTGATAFGALGFDSLMALEFRNRLESGLGVKLSAGLLWSHRTVAALADYLTSTVDIDLRSDRRAAPASAPVATALAVLPPPTDEPIAIVGMACRFPGGANTPAAFWDLLCEGRDTVVTVPKDRWDADAYYDRDPAAQGKMNTRWGAFIEGVDRFDADFFGISEREATAMDPQQRLLLEVTWEAMEDAGLVPERMRGSKTGVFLGMYANDYENIVSRSAQKNDVYAGLGNSRCFASGRISYSWDFQGPSVVLDTACSSSLAAVHLAVASLRRGECDTALVGGVNLLLSPETSVLMTKTYALSPEGRCKTFDEAADGFVRGEGCAMIALKRLSDAVEAGDRIWAVVRGSAMNQDGQSAGLTAPNVLSQKALLRSALSSAGVAAERVGFVETHGTGTTLGDPIEVEALRDVVGGPRSEGFCALGALKTNVGHLEAAAGVAGLMKLALSVHHGRIPKNLHFKRLNPNIALDGSALVLPSELIDWPAVPGARVGGVSSFGMSGTNVHVIVEQAPARDLPAAVSSVDTAKAGGDASLLVLSARSETALVALAERHADWLESDGARFDVAAICATAALRRSHHAHRIALVGTTATEIRERLRTYANDADERERAANVGGHRRVVFVYPGQGSQWSGMGVGLVEREPVFRDSVLACEEAIRDHGEFSVRELLARGSRHPEWKRVDRVQPLLFTMHVALTALLRSWGIAPDAVLGHSLGEVAAAHVAGSLSLDDAARIICRRSRLVARTSGLGAMAFAEIAGDEAEREIRAVGGTLSVAAINGPEAVLVSGDPEPVARFLERLRARGVFCRAVDVDYASHSAQMDPLLEDLRRELAPIRAMSPALPMRSTVDGRLVEDGTLDAAYWAKNLREPVLFFPTLDRIAAEGPIAVVEVSPHPVLAASLERGFRALGRDAVVIGSCRRDENERASLLDALGRLYRAGCSPSWTTVFPDGAKPLPLPGYPWQSKKFWVAPAESATHANRTDADRAGANDASSPRAVSTLSGEISYWHVELGGSRSNHLRDHRVRGGVVFPGAGYVALALDAARSRWADGPLEVAGIEIVRPLAIPDQGTATAQVVVQPGGDASAAFHVASMSETGTWAVHAKGHIARRASSSAPAPMDLGALRARCPERVDSPAFYESMSARGVDYGPAFRLLDDIARGPGEAFAEIRSAEVRSDATSGSPGEIGTPVLDACFQLLGSAVSRRSHGTFVPASIDTFVSYGAPRGPLFGHASIVRESDGEIVADVTLFGPRGETIAEARGLHARTLAADDTATAAWLYEMTWEESPRPAPAAEADDAQHGAGTWIVFAEPGPFEDDLAARIARAGGRCIVVAPGASYEAVGAGRYRVDPFDVAGYRRVLEDASTGGAASLSGVVHFASFERSAPIEARASIDHADGCVGVLHTVRALAHAGFRDPPRLWIVTRGAQPIFGAIASLNEAAVWGLGRTVAIEHPELRCAKVDLGAEPTSEDAAELWRELAADLDEDQIALRPAPAASAAGPWRRFVARIVPAPETIVEPRAGESRVGARPATGSFALTSDGPGVLDRLHLRATRRDAPARGEVEIAVRAAGLNFIDVLQAMGRYPGQSPGSLTLGGECAGTIARLGDGVLGLRVGDAVIAIASRCMASHAIADARLVLPKPERLDFDAAASIPLVFATAYYGLHDLGRVARGERVLIHSATGGVGLAALALARRAGAEVFATAGTDEKRAYLRSLGVAHVMDSRSTSFADAVMRATGGEGVDIVLNSLTGEAVTKGLSILSAYGRFIEIGKRDIYEDRAIGLSPFRKNLSYSAVDLAGMARERPALLRAILDNVLRVFSDETWAPPPIRVFPASDAIDAFRLMAQARHIGKIVVSFAEGTPSVLPPRYPFRVRRDGSYVVTGGLGGLGVKVAGWLAERGAARVVLTGRSEPSDAARAELAALAESGTEIVIARGDVCEPADVDRVLNTARAGGVSLRGVVHAAMVLDDGVLLKQDHARFARVIAPKVQGAWNLHERTRGDALDFFVMFSSAASVMGSAAQSSYAAANAFLDALAHQRRSEGLSATSIDWGAWSEVGQAARDGRHERLQGQGIDGLSPAQGLAALERVLEQERTQVMVVRLNGRQWRQSNGRVASLPVYSKLVHAAGATTGTLRRELASLAPADQRRRVEDHVREQAAQVLRIAPSRLTSATAFGSLGFDSLMALELRNRLESGLGVKLSAGLLWSHRTVAALAEHLSGAMGIANVTATHDDPPASAAAANGLSTVIESLSREETEAALDATLGALLESGALGDE